MKTPLLVFPVVVSLAAIGCASPSEDVGAASSNFDDVAVDGNPSLVGGEPTPALTLSQQAEARWREIQAEKVMGAGAVVAVQIDDGPVMLVEEDKEELEYPDVPTGGIAFFSLASQGDAPVTFRFQSKTPSDSFAPGTMACAANGGEMAITIEGEPMLSDPAACSLTFEHSFKEPVPVGTVWHLPSKLRVGSFEATVAGPSGAKHGVRAGFIIAERSF